MLNLIGRLAARLGASVLVAAAGLAVTAAAAAAVPGVDLGVTVQAGAVALGASDKPFRVKGTNHGDTPTRDFVIHINYGGLDSDKVGVTGFPEGIGSCQQGNTHPYVDCFVSP